MTSCLVHFDQPFTFAHHVRVELENGSDAPTVLYDQIDYTLEPAMPSASGYLHVSFRRENPTRLKSDLVITEELAGPGRFLGCSLGIRVLGEGIWYGEGEVKVFLDGDSTYPTICGTGLEDYVGSAWGMGRHATLYGGCTLDVRAPDADDPLSQRDFVGMYRWHLPDPIMYASDLKVTLQQIGGVLFPSGHEAEMAAIEDSGRLAGDGWRRIGGGTFTFGIVERIDDVCATAYVYCREPQRVERVDLTGAVADLERQATRPPARWRRWAYRFGDAAGNHRVQPPSVSTLQLSLLRVVTGVRVEHHRGPTLRHHAGQSRAPGRTLDVVLRSTPCPNRFSQPPIDLP
jgi:hypothetical protein